MVHFRPALGGGRPRRRGGWSVRTLSITCRPAPPHACSRPVRLARRWAGAWTPRVEAVAARAMPARPRRGGRHPPASPICAARGLPLQVPPSLPPPPPARAGRWPPPRATRGTEGGRADACDRVFPPAPPALRLGAGTARRGRCRRHPLAERRERVARATGSCRWVLPRAVRPPRGTVRRGRVRGAADHVGWCVGVDRVDGVCGGCQPGWDGF